MTIEEHSQRIGVLNACGLYDDEKNVRWHSDDIDKIINAKFNLGDLLIYDSTLKLLNSTNFVSKKYFSECEYLVYRGCNCLWGDILCRSINRDLLSKYDCPILLLGVGIQKECEPLSKESIYLLKEISERCPICVRESISMEYLAERNITNSVVIGCPSLFSDYDNIIKTTQYESYVLPLRRIYESKYVGKLFNKFPADKSTIVVQEGSQDRSIALDDRRSARFQQSVKFMNKVCSIKKTLLDQFVAPWHVSHFRDIFQDAVTVGFRLHSTLLSLSKGLPALLVLYDSRTRAFCEEFDIPSIEQDDIEPFCLEQLSDLDFSSFHKKYKQAYRRLAEVLDDMGIKHLLKLP